jgi:hypothetical protein
MLVMVFWLVPVMIVAVREIQEEMAYNRADLQRALTSWTFTDAERSAGAPLHCQGTSDSARAAGCPQAVLAENAAAWQTARDEYAQRRMTLVRYLWHAFVGYWVVPAIALLVFGMVIGAIRRALRRPPAAKVVPEP